MSQPADEFRSRIRTGFGHFGKVLRRGCSWKSERLGDAISRW